jgi:histidinol phosphatase-like PHP family hydrolase
MKYVLDHDYHIHSMLSQCSSNPDQTAENILKYAKDHGFSSIALTDHFWDECVPGASRWYDTYHKYSDISKALPLPSDPEVEFLFGCEVDMDKNGVIGISKEKYDLFDFIIVPTTHMHMKGFTIDEGDYADPDALARLWVERFDTLLKADLPFGKVGIAHLTTRCIAVDNDMHLEVIKRVPTEEMYRLFTEAARLGLGIELNGDDMGFKDQDTDTVLRPFRIAKECGCKFYYGSDAHKPSEFRVYENLDRAIELLGLSENDKFRIKK